ncbi:MAG: rod shape-determining protein RodA [Crocinitomicaceae bacterium]|nr:rod shape-determining protein RodA [Crocinitomicaceae bacterium]
MRQNESLTGSFDWALFAVYILIMSMGVATVYSAAYDSDHPSLFSFSEVYGRQLMWVGVSLFLGLLVFLIDSDIYRKFSLPIYGFTLALLIIVLLLPERNGAKSWLGIGSFGIQPGEFAKVGTAILLSSFIGSINVKQQNVRTVLLVSAIIGLPMILIMLQPDAGTFIVFTAFLFVMYREGVTFDPIILKFVNLIPGIKFRQTWVGIHFIPIIFAIVFLCLTTLIVSHEPLLLDTFPGEEFSGYWKILISLVFFYIAAYFVMRWIFAKRDRKRAAAIAIIGFLISVFISFVVNFTFEKLPSHQRLRIELLLGIYEGENVQDGADYNRNHAMAAVGSGGFFGKGYQNASVSSVETNHVPESETDFIFCPFAEEWGFAGSLLLIGLYLFMMLRIVKMAERQRSTYNRVYAYSVAVILFYHFAVNLGMNIGFAPVIGIPLPFFSYGGSSMMSFSVMMFILLKLDSQRKDVLN